MPLETPSHETTVRVLDGNYVAEYDHENNWLAIILLPSGRINLIPQTTQNLSDFLNEMFAGEEKRKTQELSWEYTAVYNHGLLTLRKSGMHVMLSVQATQMLRLFLDEMLTKSQEVQ
jgi:hypothetical protein